MDSDFAIGTGGTPRVHQYPVPGTRGGSYWFAWDEEGRPSILVAVGVSSPTLVEISVRTMKSLSQLYVDRAR